MNQSVCETGHIVACPRVVALNPATLREPLQHALAAARWMAGAYVDGELAGFVQTSEGLPDGCVEAALFVHVKWRRQRIGTLLIKAAMESARIGEARVLRLVCARTDWPMRHFAEKCGARLDLAFGQIVADIPLG